MGPIKTEPAREDKLHHHWRVLGAICLVLGLVFLAAYAVSFSYYAVESGQTVYPYRQYAGSFALIAFLLWIIGPLAVLKKGNPR